MIGSSKITFLVLNLLLASLLVSCLPAGAYYSGVATLKRNEVTMVRLTHEIVLSAEAPFVSEVARANLDRFLDLIEVRYGDRLSLDFHASEISDHGQTQLVRYFSNRGLVIQERSPVSDLVPAPGRVRLIVERYLVKAPKCTSSMSPDKTIDERKSGSGSSPAFGCSSQTLFGQMVANPRHLLQSPGDAGPIADSAIRAVTSARDGTAQNDPSMGDNLSGTNTSSNNNN